MNFHGKQRGVYTIIYNINLYKYLYFLWKNGTKRALGIF